MKRSNSLTALLDKVVNIPVLQIIILVIVFILISMFSLSAQTPRKKSGVDGSTALQIGDAIPQELWNFPLQTIDKTNGSNSITLNDYRGSKLTIIDFWATHCPPCLKSLLKGDSLQADFNAKKPNSLKIIPVTSEHSEQVFKLLKRMPHFVDILQGSVVEDRYLRKYFPHTMIPHAVWIDADGRVLYITGADEINKKNIAEVLAGSNLPNIEVKKDIIGYDKSKPIVSFQDPSFGQALMGSSILTSFIKGLPSSSGIFRDSINHTTHIKFTNLPLEMYYLYGNRHLSNIPRRRWRIPESIEVLGKTFKRLDKLNTENFGSYFCYEFSYPSIKKDSVLRAMHSDLRRLFGLSMSVIKEYTDCYIIQLDPAQSSDAANAETEMHQILNVLNTSDHIADHFFLLEKTDGKFGISLKRLSDAKTIEEIDFLLREKGLFLKKERRELEFIEFKKIYHNLNF